MQVVLLKRISRKNCTVFPTILFSDPGTVSYGSSIDSDAWPNMNVRVQFFPGISIVLISIGRDTWGS